MKHKSDCKCLDCFIAQTEREWQQIMTAVTGRTHK